MMFFMTSNQHTPLIHMQCHNAKSKENNNKITTDTTVESIHFPIYLQMKNNYYKVELENNVDRPVSYNEYKTKA